MQKKRYTNIKNQKGSMAVYVLVILLIFLMILVTIYSRTMSTRKNELTTTTKIKELYEKNYSKIDEIYNIQLKKINSNIDIGKDAQPGVLAGAGSQEDPFKIESVEDLVFFLNDIEKGNNYNGYFIELTKTLDMTDSDSYVDPNTIMFKDYNGDNQTKGLKDEVTDTNFTGLIFAKGKFQGTLDGNNNSISNIYSKINCTDYIYHGLIGELSGKIQNLKISGTINVENVKEDFYRLGSLLGKNSGTVENCESNFTINVILDKEGAENSYIDLTIASLIGNNEGTINNCKTFGTLTLNQSLDLNLTKIGSITANNEGTVNNCQNNVNTVINYNNTSIISSNLTVDLYVGGITGYQIANATLKNCVNNGNVTFNMDNFTLGNTNIFSSHVAGIVGNNKGLIENCINHSESKNIYKNMSILGSFFSSHGGIAGKNSNIINNSINDGKVSDSINSDFVNASNSCYFYSGGICSYNSNSGGSIINSINGGNVELIASVTNTTDDIAFNPGGISGYSEGIITNVVNYGKVTSTSTSSELEIGGIVGDNRSSSIVKNAYNKGIVESNSNVSTLRLGGILGNGYGTIDRTYNTGKVYSSIDLSSPYIGSIIGRSSSATVTNSLCLSSTAKKPIR